MGSSGGRAKVPRRGARGGGEEEPGGGLPRCGLVLRIALRLAFRPRLRKDLAASGPFLPLSSELRDSSRVLWSEVVLLRAIPDEIEQFPRTILTTANQFFVSHPDGSVALMLPEKWPCLEGPFTGEKRTKTLSLHRGDW